MEAGSIKPPFASEGVSPCRIHVVALGSQAFQHFTEAKGRCVDLLLVKDAGETGAGTLHEPRVA